MLCTYELLGLTHCHTKFGSLLHTVMHCTGSGSPKGEYKGSPTSFPQSKPLALPSSFPVTFGGITAIGEVCYSVISAASTMPILIHVPFVLIFSLFSCPSSHNFTFSSISFPPPSPHLPSLQQRGCHAGVPQDCPGLGYASLPLTWHLPGLSQESRDTRYSRINGLLSHGTSWDCPRNLGILSIPGSTGYRHMGLPRTVPGILGY